jgi:hypothetical protein
LGHAHLFGRRRNAALVGDCHQQAPVHQVHHGSSCPYGRGLNV